MTDAAAKWSDVTAIEARLVPLDVHLERTVRARERVETGGLFSLWARLMWGSTQRIDERIATQLEAIAACEDELAAAEQTWMHLHAADLQTAAFQLRAVTHALRVLKAIQNDSSPIRPDDLAWIRRVLGRVQRVCGDLDGADDLSALSAGIRTAIDDAQRTRNDLRPYLTVAKNNQMQAHLQAARAEDREDVALLRAAEPLLRMRRALTEHTSD